ncbi:MAG: DUF4097 domain-containing protein [Lachnospiraceae bacterium]|nr:DUF4097 domain-containing protein [Lachnospiraceae bacterium]
MRSRKGSIAIGIILLVAGIATCVVSFVVLGFDPEKLANVQFSENTYEVNESFRNIEIKSSIEHVRFAVSSDGKCRVATYCPDTISAEAMVEDNCLKIRTVDEGGVKGHIGIFVTEPYITVYLPEKSYGSLQINQSFGKVSIPKGFTFTEADIESTTGGVSVSADITDSVAIKTTTGDVLLRDVAVSGDMNISCTTGEVQLEDCDASAITIKTSTGDVSGTLLTPKTFITDTSTGDIDVPDSEGEGRCEISTATGDIDISIR